jgi:predicted nucleic acid-binding Zn ribbon protein
MNTKECRHCRQPIHAQARVCQHCQSIQGWFASQRDPRFALVLVGLLLLLVVPIFAWLPSLIAEPGGRPNLSVSGTTVRYSSAPEGTRVFALGQIQNESGVDASRVWLRLELFDASDRLVDTLMQDQSGLIVPRSGTRPFRITGLIGASPNEVKRVAVTVERARERGRYD